MGYTVILRSAWDTESSKLSRALQQEYFETKTKPKPNQQGTILNPPPFSELTLPDSLMLLPSGIPRHFYVLPVFFYHISILVQPPQLSYMLRIEAKVKGRYFEIPKMQESYATHSLPSAISTS